MAFGRRVRPRREPVPEDLADLIGTLREMAYAMTEQALAAHQMMDQVGKQP